MNETTIVKIKKIQELNNISPRLINRASRYYSESLASRPVRILKTLFVYDMY
jgi:hypothetical protein